MQKASKTYTSQSIFESCHVNNSIENDQDDYKSFVSSNPKKVYVSCLAVENQIDSQDQKRNSEDESKMLTKDSFYSQPLTPNPRKHIFVPEVKNYLSQHRSGSKISSQLNQISEGFNKENLRIQRALFEIRQSSAKKEKQRELSSLSRLKKSGISQNTAFKDSHYLSSVSMNLNFEKAKKKKTGTKLKKKNLSQMMREQRSLISQFSSSINHMM